MKEDPKMGVSPNDGRQEQTEAQSRRAAKDEIIVAALAAGRSYREAGDKAGVDKRTVARRMAQSDFAERVRHRRSEFVAATDGRLAREGPNAADTIAASLDDPDPRVRLSAARLLLSLGIRSSTQNELERELTEIRQMLEGSG